MAWEYACLQAERERDAAMPGVDIARVWADTRAADTRWTGA